ncbi:iron-siderophore ABC transporter substrate-binding protein [Anabaena sp. WFMT]|uniref:iron-siderophore ABC transporter substrate-binding protein n=1 Tax=Anabaena sp. WFMT TaxID=3449730 RepID=UPI003F282472
MKNSNFQQPSTECRVVKHSMGETCIPKNPERVITIFHGTLGNVLSLGIKPIGSGAVGLNNPVPAYLQNQVGEMESLGDHYQPNLEKILMLKPDLILVWQNMQQIYPILAKISPTAIVPWYGPAAWREHFEFVTKALGKEKEAQQAWKHYYQKINELKQVLGVGAASPFAQRPEGKENRYQNQEISVISASSQWGFSIQAKNSFAGSILNDLGLKRPKVQDVNTSSGYLNVVSEEEVTMLDGDIIFVLSFKDDDRKFLEEILQKPLVKQLKAVQQGNVYLVDGLAWIGSNLLAADVVIDDLFKYLIKTPQKTK